jgi:hypothetical protein
VVRLLDNQAVEELLKRASIAVVEIAPPSGRDLSQTVIWAGIVAASETIPAQIDQ